MAGSQFLSQASPSIISSVTPSPTMKLMVSSWGPIFNITGLVRSVAGTPHTPLWLHPTGKELWGWSVTWTLLLTFPGWLGTYCWRREKKLKCAMIPILFHWRLVLLLETKIFFKSLIFINMLYLQKQNWSLTVFPSFWFWGSEQDLLFSQIFLDDF